MSSAELKQLLNALEERNIGLNSDDVAWAFESAGTKHGIESWVRQYLNTASLLSAEERAFVEKQGQKATSATSAAQETSDQSFEDAISSLEAITAAIEKQCRLLDSQRQALQTIKQRSAAKDSNGHSTPQRDGKIAREKSQLQYQSDELVDSLQSKFRAATKHSESASSNAPPNVERVLEKDDRLLDGLEKVLPHLSGGEGDDAGAEEMEKLCQALKILISSDIRTRIDAAYLEGASHTSAQANGVNGKSSRESRQLTSVNAELEELCREIEGLSTMAVDNQYRNPIVSATSTANTDAEIEKAAWADYLSSAIHYSTGRMEHLLKQLEDQRAHSSATKTISAALDQVLEASKDRHDDSQHGPKSPVKSMQKGLKPLRLVQANLSDAQDPASQLLRQLDLRLSGELDSSTLSDASADKLDKLLALRANSERSISDQIAHSLSTTDEDAQQLLRAVFAHSQHGSVHLESEGVRSGLDGLESQTQDLSEKMRTLDMDGIIKTTGEKQAKLLEQLNAR